VRQPIATLQVAVPAAVKGRAFADLLDILAAEVNAKRIEVAGSDHELVRLKGKAEFRSLGKRYGKETPRVAALVSQLTAEQLQTLERGVPVQEGEFEFRPEDVTVTREVVSDWAVQADGPFVAAVDPRLTVDLIQEGLAREIVNRVQRVRKDAGYDFATRIELSIAGAEDVVAAAAAFQGFIEGETLARNMLQGGVLDPADVIRELDIDGRAVTIAVRRHDARKGGTR
jgi:isoleucyl-tRNA synthetase